MSTTRTAPKVGTAIVARVHPALNGGREEAHAIVVGTNEDGTVNATVFPDTDSSPFRMSGLPVLTRDEHDQVLADAFKLLPGHKVDAKGKIEPGINPQTDLPWRVYDALHWHPAALTDADQPRPAAAADPIQARLEALREQKAKREAEANDPRMAEIRALEAELADDDTTQ